MKDFENICMGCMNEISDGENCKICGEVKGTPQEAPFLPKKTEIGSRYIIGKGLSSNGEGLSYIGYDKVKEARIYIKEFFPKNICLRNEDFKIVKIKEDMERTFKREFNGFLSFYRSVARLRNIPAICAVYDIFEENNTAYVVMEWIDDKSLEKFVLDNGGRLNWEDVKPMMLAFLSALGQMHESGVLHLGISPKTLVVTQDKKLRLKSFAIRNLRKLGSCIDVELNDGCSALEQYIEMYDVDQSTDVYGFTASLFFVLTGEYPPKATKRKKDDQLLMPKDIVREIPDRVISGIASGLRVYPNNRTLSFERLKAELSTSNIDLSKLEDKDLTEKESSDKIKNKNFTQGIIACGIALGVLVVFFVVYWLITKKNAGHSSDIAKDLVGQSLASSDSSETEEQEKKKITVPDLSGKNYDELKSQDKANLGYEILLISEEFNDDVAEKCIISQTPGSGEEIYEGGIVAVNVSKGSKLRKLPNIKGKTISEASIAISNVGVIPIETWAYSDDVAEGYIVGYEGKKEGEFVEYHSEVIIVRSLGKEKFS